MVPVSQPPIADGAVLISGNRIAAVGRWRDLYARHQAAAQDLGEVILLPGLINAHCHLDYTDMAGEFPPPRLFTDWIKLITAAKAGWSYSEYAQSWLNGAHMLLRNGTTTVADIEAVPELLPETWDSTLLRVRSFVEMIAVRPQRLPSTVLAETVQRIKALAHDRSRAELSPHAPYSTVPELLRLTAEVARHQQWRVCVHVAESALEFQMFTRGRGAMFDWLRWMGRDMSDAGKTSPVRHLERCGLLGNNLLAIHANYLARGDAALLGRHGVHVVHCPRSHAYFDHAPFPRGALSRAGVNICIGTDSLATVLKSRRETVELDMFAEMRTLAKADGALPARKIVQMATLNGARALGLGGQVGELSEGAHADLIAIPFSGRLSGAYAAISEHRGGVTVSMIDGRWAVTPA